jgi:hypothetical protein
MAVLSLHPQLVQSETMPVSLSVGWGRYPCFFRHRLAVSGFAILISSEDAFVVSGVRNDLVLDCT